MTRLFLQTIIIIFVTLVILIDWRLPAILISFMNSMVFQEHEVEQHHMSMQPTPSFASQHMSIETTTTPSVLSRRDVFYSQVTDEGLNQTPTPVNAIEPIQGELSTAPPIINETEPRIPHTMKGLVGRDPYFEIVNGRVNKRSQDTMGRIMHSLGVHWVRIEMRIPLRMDATEADIDLAISRYDYFIESVAPQHNLKVLMLLSFDLIMGVNPNQISNGPYFAHPQYGPYYNRYMTEWMNRAQKVVRRYGKKIHAIEVLNEANRLPRYSESMNNAIPADVWAQLITTLYMSCNDVALELYCRSTPIILGGLHPRGSVASDRVPARTDMEYLADIYASQSFTNAFSRINRWPLDGVGYHPYPWELSYIDVQNQTQAFDRLRQQLVALGDPLRPVWVTEVGYNVAYAQQTESGQSKFLYDVYSTLAARRLLDGSLEIPVVFWFKYEDFPPDEGMGPQNWGLVQIPFVPGPCPDDFCYRRSGEPERYRKAWYTYRDLTLP